MGARAGVAMVVATIILACDGAFADPEPEASGAALSELEQHLSGLPKSASPSFMSYDNVPRVLVFTGYDGWAGGGFGHGGLVWSPDGLNKDGFVFKTLGGAGTYRYKSGQNDIVGTQFLASALPGWRFKADRFELTTFAGLDVQHHMLSPDDPGNALRGTRAGLRVGADVWWEPTVDMMATASASFSTIGTSYWTRGALGWRVLEAFYLGPEVHAMGDEVYRQWRVGAHVTAFRYGPWEWSAGVGYVEDSSERSGVYGRIGLLTRQ